jgi:hypothetical protein
VFAKAFEEMLFKRVPDDNIGVAPLKERGHLIDNSKEKAQILIKQFSSVLTREKVNKMPITPSLDVSSCVRILCVLVAYMVPM